MACPRVDITYINRFQAEGPTGQGQPSKSPQKDEAAGHVVFGIAPAAPANWGWHVRVQSEIANRHRKQPRDAILQFAALFLCTLHRTGVSLGREERLTMFCRYLGMPMGMDGGRT